MKMQLLSPVENRSDAEWPVWTSGNSELLIDGLTITQVLSNVNIQLETLRKRTSFTRNGTTLENELSNLFEKVVNVEKSSIEKIRDMEMMMEVMKSKIDSIEKSKAEKSDLSLLEILMSGRIEALERRIVAVEISLVGTEVSGLEADNTGGEADTSITKRLEVIETKVMSLSHSSPTLESDHQTIINQLNDMKKQLDILPKKITDASDSCSINGCKIKDLENLFQELDLGHNVMKITIERLPIDCYAAVKDEITELYDKKADRLELSKKADIVQLHLKADLSDVSVMNDLSNQLGRKIEANLSDVNDSLQSLRSNYDKRLESLLQWTLKQLRRLAANGNMSQEMGVTDIGKVKCLVCDQVVNQLVETDIVFGGPPLPVTLKTLANSRPLPFETGTDKDRSNRPRSAATHAWTHGSNTIHQNRSSSPSRSGVFTGSTKSFSNRLSSQNLEIFNASLDLEKIFQNPHEASVRVRPSTSSCVRGESERSGMLNTSTAASKPQIGGMMTAGDRILSQFRELEL